MNYRRFVLLLALVALLLGVTAAIGSAQVAEVARENTLVIENISVRNPGARELQSAGERLARPRRHEPGRLRVAVLLQL